ncbi:MAG: hypothetical protein N4A68_16350 [Maledivibacter sp.]|jgi:hypothetical protein|nr:hypothetical protein [Maledivibacter sp.]
MTTKAQSKIADPGNKYLGAGAVYFNFGESDEMIIGATKGGSSFNANREFMSVEQDGAYGEVKGLRRKIKVSPQLLVNTLELHKDNITKFFGGTDLEDSNEKYYSITERINLKDEDYIKNVAFVGENQRGEDMVIILHNALGDGNIEMAIEHESDIVPQVQFTAHYDPQNPKKAPYEIRLPKHKA